MVHNPGGDCYGWGVVPMDNFTDYGSCYYKYISSERSMLTDKIGSLRFRTVQETTARHWETPPISADANLSFTWCSHAAK